MTDIILPILFLVGAVSVIALIAVPFVLRGRKKGKIRHANFVATKALYEKAMLDLQENPEHVDARTKALQVGREYYAYLHPQLCNFGSDERPLRHHGDPSQISFRDDAEIIETKIQSDIQARIGKGKVS
ncbi:MAG: hypothetical protein ACLGG0_14255 [Bacteriovoracia bacterium]